MNDIFDQSITQTPVAQSQQIGDLDLSGAVKRLLEMTNINTINYDSNPGIMASIGKDPKFQLFHQQDFWTYQLLLLQQDQGINTFEDRVLVNQFTDPKSWFEYFSNNVLDLIQLYNLPIRHGW